MAPAYAVSDHWPAALLGESLLTRVANCTGVLFAESLHAVVGGAAAAAPLASPIPPRPTVAANNNDAIDMLGLMETPSWAQEIPMAQPLAYRRF